MSRPTIDEQQIEEHCSLTHGSASASIDLIDENNKFLDEIYARWPAARDWLMRIRENNGALKQHQRRTQRGMRKVLDLLQGIRTDTDRLGKLKHSND